MKTSEVLFSLIKEEVFGVPCNFSGDFTFDEVALFNLARKHDLAHLIAGPVERNRIKINDGELYNKIIKRRKNAVARETRIENASAIISEVFQNSGIDHIFLKGSVIRTLYPEPWMRTSCDIDVLIKEKDLARATKALTEVGFETDGKKEFHDVSFYYSQIHLELHFSVLENDPQTDGLLSKIWEHTVSAGGCEYKETNEFFVFHHVAHAAYHLLSGGCGIRFFIDLKLMMDKDFYDDNALIALLNECNLVPCYEAFKNLVNVWFSGATPTESTERLAKFVLKGGAFGNGKNALYVDLVKKKKSKFGYKLSLAFLPYGDMCVLYPSLKGRGILLPFYYLHRIFIKLFGKDRQRARMRLKMIDEGKTDVLTDAEMLIRDLGLDR